MHLLMKKEYLLLFVFLRMLPDVSCAEKIDSPFTLKPRIVVLTDVSTWETDDSESLVRLFAYADVLEIEGVIYTTGWSLDEIRDDFLNLIHIAINAYEKDLPNLMKRSNQKKHFLDENKQMIGYWPSADYLRERTVFGSRKRGMEFIGEDNASPGSDLIIKEADELDERPLWVLLWGGGNTVAQAIWEVQNKRSGEDLLAFLDKIPIYAITDQDRDQKTPFEISSLQWLRHEFEKDIVFLWDESAWMYQNGTGKNNWDEYEKNIQGHGNLGNAYPKYKFGVEGDTPSFLHVMPNGLNDPAKPDNVGWGGYFEWGIGPDNETYAYNNHQGRAKEISFRYERYFYPAIFNDFAARMDWAKEGSGNRNPVVVINGELGISAIEIHARQGEDIILDASSSYDLENDKLTYEWWLLSEAGTYVDNVIIQNADTQKATVISPPDSAGNTIHIVCEVTDNGIPNLTGYRRVIINYE